MSDFPLSKYVALATPYVFGVSALHLYGFWSTFGINIFEFIGINDVIKLAIYNIASFSGLFLLGYLWGMPLDDFFPSGGGRDTAIGRFGRRHWKILFSLDAIIVFLIIVLLKDRSKWLLMFPFFLLLSFPLIHLDFFIQLIPNHNIRRNVLILLFALPILTFINAKYESYNIIEGKGKFTVDLLHSNLEITGDNPVAYLGLAGNYFFLYGIQTRRVFIVKVKDKELIALVPNTTPETGQKMNSKSIP